MIRTETLQSKHELEFDPPDEKSQCRTVRANGMAIGFRPIDKEFIYLQRCPDCKKENYAFYVALGSCGWCGWDANDN